MLTHIAIRNFQSLRQVDLDLGTFTVIVGPSSSGKSALMRAFKAVASNVRGSQMITRGQKQMAITYRTDTHAVTLERTDKSGTYRLMDNSLTELTFTKLNGEVPQHVQNALRLEPVPVNGTSVNFASQFDKPYLLDESGAVIARVLGELTNVNTIFEAVRTANKVRLNASTKLKTRQADLAGLRTRLGEFRDLAAHLSALEDAERLYEQHQDLLSRIGRLETAIRTLRIAERALDKAVLPEVPSAQPLTTATKRLFDLRAKVGEMVVTLQRLDTAEQQVQETTETENLLIGDLRAVLVDAKMCPTCGQSTV